MNYDNLTKEELISLIEENENITGKYGLVWDKEKEPEETVVNCDKNIPILTEVNDKKIIKGDINNILIEGDNFHSLSVLNYTHKDSIDIIYIDPPYNTGNKDFVYNDSYVDIEDGYRHSKWLNFMNKRLRLAKELLKDDGIIFISIGDDEEQNLKQLCNQVFGENNFIENYIWESTFRPDNSSPILRRNAEFVLCYAKDKRLIDYFNGDISESEGMPSLTKAKEKIKTIKFPENYVKTLLKDGIYSKGMKDNGKQLQWELVEDAEVKDGVFITPVVLRGHSYWATDKKINEEMKNGTEIWIKSESFVPYYKKKKLSINRPTKILNRESVKDYLYANAELNAIFEKKPFNNPKPSTLIKYLINFIDKKNAIILDFFAGSGTTGQAVLELNKEDGGHRQFILCTNNENNICEEITYERLKRVINGYSNKEGHETNLNYYKCEFVENSNNRDQLYFDLTEKCIPMMCVKDNNYIEYKSTNEYKIFTNEYKTSYSCVYYSLFGDKEDEFIKELENIDGYKSVYKFSLGETVDTSIFKNVKNYSIEAIPYKIVELYKRIVKMSRED